MSHKKKRLNASRNPRGMARAKLSVEPKAGSTELARLREENKELRSRLDQIAELANGDASDLDEEDEEDLDDEEEEEEEEEELE